MNKKLLNKFIVYKDCPLIEVMKIMDTTEKMILYVVDDKQHLFGVVTDGDIRRWILESGELTGTAKDFCNTNPICIENLINRENIKNLMLEYEIFSIPITKDHKIIDIVFWDDIFEKEMHKSEEFNNISAVIMAGGKGTRLDPFTKILPKPLIPVGDKPIIKHIIDNFYNQKINEFHIALNYKSESIRAYFEEYLEYHKINFIEEDEPLGTAGALRLLSDNISDDFFVTNCDILVRGDYNDLLNFHINNGNKITLVASAKKINIPYGVCKINGGGTLSEITEKPEFDFLVNTGFYVLNKSVLKLIKPREIFHMTDLIQSAQDKNLRIGVYPISQDAWVDIGKWDEYKKVITNINSLLI